MEPVRVPSVAGGYAMSIKEMGPATIYYNTINVSSPSSEELSYEQFLIKMNQKHMFLLKKIIKLCTFVIFWFRIKNVN